MIDREVQHLSDAEMAVLYMTACMWRDIVPPLVPKRHRETKTDRKSLAIWWTANEDDRQISLLYTREKIQIIRFRETYVRDTQTYDWVGFQREIEWGMLPGKTDAFQTMLEQASTWLRPRIVGGRIMVDNALTPFELQVVLCIGNVFNGCLHPEPPVFPDPLWDHTVLWRLEKWGRRDLSAPFKQIAVLFDRERVQVFREGYDRAPVALSHFDWLDFKQNLERDVDWGRLRLPDDMTVEQMTLQACADFLHQKLPDLLAWFSDP